MERDLTKGPIAKTLLAFAFPMMISITLQFLISGSLIIKTSDHHSPVFLYRMVYWFPLFLCQGEVG